VRSKIIIQAFLSFGIKWRKSQGNDHNIAELIQSAGKTTRSEIHRFEIRQNYLDSGRSQLLYLFARRELTKDRSNFRGISYKTLYHIIRSRLTFYVTEIICHHRCAFLRNTSNVHYIFCISQVCEEKNWNEKQLFVGFNKTYSSFKREGLL
jgi:hypothetical protein